MAAPISRCMCPQTHACTTTEAHVHKHTQHSHACTRKHTKQKQTHTGSCNASMAAPASRFMCPQMTSSRRDLVWRDYKENGLRALANVSACVCVCCVWGQERVLVRVRTCAYACSCVYLCQCVCLCLRVHGRVIVCMLLRKYAHVSADMHACVLVCLCTCVLVCLCARKYVQKKHTVQWRSWACLPSPQEATEQTPTQTGWNINKKLRKIKKTTKNLMKKRCMGKKKLLA